MTANDITTPLRVLFLCTRNAARSQIAEAMLADAAATLAPGRFESASAGAAPGDEVHPLAVQVLAEQGIDWRGRRPKSIDDISGQPWDLVVTVCDNANESCPILPGQRARAHWGLDDPHELADFRAVLDTLRERMRRLVTLPAEALQPDALQVSAQAIADEASADTGASARHG